MRISDWSSDVCSADLRSAPKAAAARKATPKPPAKKPEKARATGKGGVVQDVRQFRVQSDDDGIRLDRWFKRHLPDVGFNIVSRWARTGQLRVDGARATPGARVAEGQVIRVPPAVTAAAPVQRVRPIDLSETDIAFAQAMVLYKDPPAIGV